MEATPIVKKPEPDWFLVNRKLIHDSRWLSEPFSRGQAWVDMVGLAQYKDGFIRVRGIRVDILRGQLGYSQLSLSKRWKWSRGKVRRFLEELEERQDVIQQNGHETTIITIVNYDVYQFSTDQIVQLTGQQAVHQTDIKRTTNGTHTKKDKKDKKKKKKKRAKPTVFTPPTLEQAKEYAKKTKQYDGPLDGYFDHYNGNGWKVGPNIMKSWTATLSKAIRQGWAGGEKDSGLKPDPQSRKGRKCDLCDNQASYIVDGQMARCPNHTIRRIVK
tara:strand:- start:4955 stop:5770 length:816 start_codon:yes stop_codon:yes gene_type:complete